MICQRAVAGDHVTERRVRNTAKRTRGVCQRPGCRKMVAQEESGVKVLRRGVVSDLRDGADTVVVDEIRYRLRATTACVGNDLRIARGIVIIRTILSTRVVII